MKHQEDKLSENTQRMLYNSIRNLKDENAGSTVDFRMLGSCTLKLSVQNGTFGHRRFIIRDHKKSGANLPT